jgi:hypothetical protein
MYILKLPVWLICASTSLALHMAILSAVPERGGMGSGYAGGAPEAISARITNAHSAETGMTEWVAPVRLAEMARPSSATRKLLPWPNVSLPDHFDESDYVASSQLTTRPSASHAIVVPYPKGSPHEGVRRGVLILFIDERGVVTRARVRDGELPEEFEDAAFTAFKTAVFNPGRIGDMAVKARMAVEVEFDSGTDDFVEPPRLMPREGKP